MHKNVSESCLQKPASSQAIASLQIIIDMINKNIKHALSEIKKNNS